MFVYPEDYRFLQELNKPRKIESDDVACILVHVGMIATLVWGIIKWI